MNKVSEKELHYLWRKRIKDSSQLKTYRQKKISLSPTRVGQILYNIFKSDAKTLLEMDKVRAIASWQQFVGKSIANFSKAKTISNGKLIVQVEDPVLRQELLFLKSDLLKKYQKAFPTLKITDIYFKALL